METVSEMYKNFPSWFSANTNPSRDYRVNKKKKVNRLIKNSKFQIEIDSNKGIAEQTEEKVLISMRVFLIWILKTIPLHSFYILTNSIWVYSKVQGLIVMLTSVIYCIKFISFAWQEI